MFTIFMSLYIIPLYITLFVSEHAWNIFWKNYNNMNTFLDVMLRFLIIPEYIKKFLSFFIMQYQSFFAPFTKKIIWMSSEPFSPNITPNATLETSKFTVLRLSTLLESIKLSARTLDAEHRERLTLFFFPSPLSSLLFFSRKKRMYRARGKINHLAWLFKLARWNCRFRRWFRVPADFHSEKSRHPLLRSLPLVILTLSYDR